MRTLLAVGASELELLRREKKLLRDQFNLHVRVDYGSGRTIHDCPPYIETLMKPDVDFILIWALTPLAWQKKSISNGDKSTTVFEPVVNFTVEGVPNIMDQITKYAKKKNPRVKVYLMIPPVKDMYVFNQKRITKAWGPAFADHLKDDDSMSPRLMREHSIRSLIRFEDLAYFRYKWTDKTTLRGSEVFNYYYGTKPV